MNKILSLKSIVSLISYVLFALCLSSCSSSDDEFANSAEETLFGAASQALSSSNWERAIAIFQQLESQYPFGQYASQAQVEIVYAYYRNGEPEAARAAADRFIRLQPDDENIDYAYYMKGMSYYSEDSSMLARYLPTDPSKRDPGKARESFGDFSQLISRFPNSPYAPDARARMIYLRNLLAEHEVHVAEFYIQRQAYVSSLNRARYVVENYQGAPIIPRALEIIVEMYLRLGLNDLADTTLEILKQNHPDSSTIDENGNFIVSTQITDPSFIYSVTFGLLGSNKRDTPLAPNKRPSANDPYSATTPNVEVERPRSFLNVISLGTLGDPGFSIPPAVETEATEE